jgi:hypothetical protein
MGDEPVAHGTIEALGGLLTDTGLWRRVTPHFDATMTDAIAMQDHATHHRKWPLMDQSDEEQTTPWANAPALEGNLARPIAEGISEPWSSRLAARRRLVLLC